MKKQVKKSQYRIADSDSGSTAIAKAMPPAVHWRASLYGAAAATVAFGCTDWLDSAVATNDRNRRYLKELLDEHLPQVGLSADPTHQ